MNDIIKELDKLLLQIQENRNTFDISEDTKLEELKRICHGSDQMVAIYELEEYSFSMVDCSSNASSFLGIKKEEIDKLGFKYILKIIHPENINAVYRFIKYFKDPVNYNKTFSHTFYLKSGAGWEWTYASIKPAIFRPDGTVRYLLAVGCSINHLLKTREQVQHFSRDYAFLEENMEKYLSLTVREKEILKLITEEYTSQEIAVMLSISPLTVDTHRKHLIGKLQVKSSIGLAKFALLFNLV